MIPTMRRAGQFVLRSFRGRFDAARQVQSYRAAQLAEARPFLTVLHFASVILPLLLLLGLIATILAHPASAAGVPLVIGSTTGTTTGTDFSGLNDMLKERYTKAFENNVEKDEEISDFITKAEGFEVIEGPDGKQIHPGHIFSSGGGVGGMLEDDYLYTPTNPTTKQSAITIKQLVAIVQLSGRTMRRVMQGPAAFVTWASEALPRKAQRLAFHKDRMRLGTGTGIIARYNGTPDGTGDPLDTMYGINGLDDRAAMLVLRDDNIRVGPNADGSSLRAGTALIGKVDYVNNAIDTTVAGVTNPPTSAADNDYIFLGDANVQGFGSREMMGLEGIIDDGTNLTAFQGITTRSNFPELCSQIVDSSGTGWDQTLSEELLDYADSLCYERGNMGRPSRILVNRSGQRSFWKNLRNDRVINDPAGIYQGGKVRLKMMLGDRIVTIQAARKVPASRCYGTDGRGIQRFKIGNARWDDTDGSVWNRVVDSTGRKDAFFAVYIEEEEMGAGDPAGSFKITNLASA